MLINEELIVNLMWYLLKRGKMEMFLKTKCLWLTSRLFDSDS